MCGSPRRLVILWFAAGLLGCGNGTGVEPYWDDDYDPTPVESEILFTVWDLWTDSYSLWITSNDLSEHEPLLSGGEGGYGEDMGWACPCYLPDVSRIALCGADGSHIGLFTMDLDGSDLVRHAWVEDPSDYYDGPACALACSPTEPVVAVSLTDTDAHLFDLSTGGLTSTLIDVAFDVHHLAWSPGGSALLVSGEGIAVVRPDGSDLRQIRSSGTDARVNVQGTQLVFTEPLGDGYSYVRDVFLADVDATGEILQEACLTDAVSESAYDLSYTEPRFTPDGETILYVSRYWAEDADPCCSSSLHAMDMQERIESASLTPDVNHVYSFEIASNGEDVVVSGSPGDGWDQAHDYGIHRVAIDGTGAEHLTPDLPDCYELEPTFLGGGAP